MSASISKSLIYITAKDLDDHNNNPDSHPDLFQKIKDYISEALKNLSCVVKTINGNGPDKSGNVDLDFIPKSGGTFNGRVSFFSIEYYIDSGTSKNGSAFLRSVSTTENISSGQNITSDGSILAGGNITADGCITGSKTYHAVYNDYAELMPKGEDTSPGDILALDISSLEERYIKASKQGQPDGCRSPLG